MRTKTLLSITAVLAAGLAASVAQTVYSVNAVGYVNSTIKPGYNLIANPLNGTNNLISTVIPPAGLPDNLTVITWNAAIQDFGQSVFVDTGAWYDLNGQPAVISLVPGKAFFVQSFQSTNINLTFVGDVPQGAVTNTISAGYDFLSSIVPQSAGLSTIGFPGVENLTYATFHNNGPSSQDYDQPYTYVGFGDSPVTGWVDSGFSPSDPTPSVAQGFLITNPVGSPAQTWGRTFSVN